MTPDAPDWEGQTMFDRAGKKIGTIEEIYLVEETDRPEWALVSVSRRRTTLVPLAGARPGAEGVRAAYDKKIVNDAPDVDRGEPSEKQVTATYRHYGIDYDDNAQQAPEVPQGQGSASPQYAKQQRGGNMSRSSASDAGGKKSGGSTLKRTVKEFSADNLPHWAAALTYYGVLSIFPALLALVSILGLIGSSAIQPMIDNLSKVAPGPAKEILTGALEGLQQGGGAGLLFIVALGGAIWAASGYISAFMDASNAIYDIEEGRPIWKKLPLRIAITVLMLVLLAISALAVVLTGPLAQQAGKLIGIGSAAVTIWDIAKWPILVLIVAFMFAVLYYSAPNVKQPSLKAVMAGGVLAVVLWIIASALFAFYVANFGSYNKTYGALGGVIVFLVWLWLTNLAILLGAEFNAERARTQHIKAGHAPDQEPYLPARSQP
ncbi:MAG TPA: YhjD/YihY/BrkB family envelope integrity protein [Solirubrobacteraceae bacterium]|nr:YhjD/YihY/BrkB family envelope integrity protein [Solirubrobacteraceae bacterium]